jgi:hypothetical protein
MIGIVQDPNDPNKLVLTQTTTVYLDKLIKSLLDTEVASLIREQAVHDIRTNKAVKKVIQEAATKLLLEKLGVQPDEEKK